MLTHKRDKLEHAAWITGIQFYFASCLVKTDINLNRTLLGLHKSSSSIGILKTANNLAEAYFVEK